MPWTQQLPDGRWRAFWRDGDRRQRSATLNEHGVPFRAQKDARKYALDREAVESANSRSARQRGGLTWGEWCERWQATRRVEPGTRVEDDKRITRHLMPKWGRVKLERITRTDVQMWVAKLERDGLSASTVRHCYYNLSRSLKEAVRAGHLAASPCQHIDLPRRAPGAERFLTREEFWLLRSRLNAPYRHVAVLLAYTGLRFGELAGLHWDRVDLDRGLINVVETWDAKARRIKAYPKSGHTRVVPIAEPAADALAALSGDRTGPCGLPHATGGCRSALVAPSVRGRAMETAVLRDRLLGACADTGLPAIRVHDLRHTYASWLAQDGVPMQEIQRLLGHGSVLVTGRYAHLAPNQFDRALAALR